MDGEFRTVFETSYSSNGSLQGSLLFLGVGLGVVVLLNIPWVSAVMRLTAAKRIIFLCFWVPIWFLFSSLWLYSNLSNGRKFTSALANNRCDVVEGVVQVLHEEPRDGHDPEGGDHIRIDDKEFVYSAWTESLSYKRTISHGGELTNGVQARLHYIGKDILKVEIKQ